jgi:hypothetical protein
MLIQIVQNQKIHLMMPKLTHREEKSLKCESFLPT